jgi:predicted nucleotidyltransferase
MFSVSEREHVRERLLEVAESDSAVVGAAVTGSHAVGASDRWSDIDIALGISGPLDVVIDAWTKLLRRDFGALHHWDLRVGPSLYRVFLLPGWLEVDIAFTPEADFGPLGPQWRTVFGATVQLEPLSPPRQDNVIGLGWHHALHARVCIERGRWWQAEYWISAIRDQVLALACLRLGHASSHAKAAHLLPEELVTPLESTLVRSLDVEELARALDAAVKVFAEELNLADPAVAARLRPWLEELVS